MKRIIDRIGWVCQQRRVRSRELARAGGLSIVVALRLTVGVGVVRYISNRHLAALCRVLEAQPADLLVIREVCDG